MNDEKRDWSFVDNKGSEIPEVKEKDNLPSVIQVDDTAMELQSTQKSMLAQWKEGKIKNSTALTILKEKMSAHIEATRYALQTQLKLHNKKIDLMADKYLYQMTEEYLKDLNVMGVSNLKSRGITAQVLNEETTKLLDQVQSQDVPEIMKSKTLDMIMNKWQELFEKISS